MIPIDLAKTLEIPEVEIKLINANIKPENVFAMKAKNSRCYHATLMNINQTDIILKSTYETLAKWKVI